MRLTWTQVKSDLGPKRFTIRTVPALLAKTTAWEDYCVGQRPLEQAFKQLGKQKSAARHLNGGVLGPHKKYEKADATD